ncbi:transcriptional regulator, partial [Corynebacterium diphtheriae]
MSSVTAPRLDRATMRRKSKQKAADRWKTDPESDYATAQRETLAAANKRGA